MDFMKAGEAMLRSSQPLLPFLAPAAYRQPARRMAFVSRHCSAQPMQTSLSRSFATSMRNRQDTATAADPAPEHPDSPAAVKPKTSATEDISSILDSTLDGTKGTPTTPTARSTRFASNRNQHENSRSRNMLSHTTLDDVLAGMGGPPSPTGGRDVGRSLNPRAAREGPLAAPKPAPMKLGPHLGKTIHIEKNRGIDVAGAFRRLDGALARNYVRKDFNRQRFHERGGMKRKRLNMERWRKRFRYAFKATCKRVMQMKKQGW